MAERSKIEWTDDTFNPWVGCTKVSPACDHCYAEGWSKRGGQVTWGAGQPRRRTTPANWRQPVKWNAQPFFECTTCGFRSANPLNAQCVMRDGALRTSHVWKPARRRVFCASLADVFDNEVPLEWREDLFRLIQATPNLDWLLLTKRIGNVPMMVSIIPGWLPQNVWLGATICNQAEADRDIVKLLAVPAARRFLSIEPMLGPIDLEPWLDPAAACCMSGAPCHRCPAHAMPGPVIDWVICGGESGPHARPMHPDWPRSLRDQCAAAGVPFFFKQHGEWLSIDQQTEAFTDSLYRSNRIAEPDEDQGALDESYGRTCRVPVTCVHADGSTHDLFESNAFLAGRSPMTTFKVGKKRAGALLDEKLHREFPASAVDQQSGAQHE